MTDLPNSIESALLEAGFSGTEVVTIKKLLQEDAMTLRELAAKTGKSTGVLDQAIKKLLKKGIIAREVINDHPKYSLKSLDVVLKWMEDDTKVKQEMIVRRHQNFETFVRSLVETQSGNRRPEMEFFEGREGIQKAYMQLLHRGNDIAQYGPTLYLAEEDPLRECKVQWFRERQRRGIFSRVITHNTVKGRRFQSRDPFEYRKSILVDEDSYPFNFEKIIIGDTIACFETNNERACFIRYPEYAENERVFFDRLWNKKMQNASSPAYPVDDEGNHVPPSDIIIVPFATKTLSSFREFILSRRSISVLIGFGLLAALCTYGLYLRDISMNTKRVQDRALSIAATGALQFDIADLDQLHTIHDLSKPAYAKVVYQLNLIRSQNPGTKYAYIMRPTKDPLTLEFVADADSLDPYKKGDLNHDAIIDEADDLPIPGESFDISQYRWMQKVFLKEEAIVSDSPETDKWGTFLSGVGPIKDASGKTIALFGIDIESSTVQDLSTNMIVLSGTFLGLFLMLVLIRLMAFNRSLLNELKESCRLRKNILIMGVSGIATLIISSGLYFHHVITIIESARQQVETIATTGALQFHSEDLNELKTMADIKKPVYEKVVHQLKNILENNSQILYVYLIRPKSNATTFEFIAEAGGLDIFAQKDGNKDGVVDTGDEIAYPGLPYDIGYFDTLVKGTYYNTISDAKPYSDKWGMALTGYAPIKNSNGSVSALLAIDISAKGFYMPTLLVFLPFIVYGFCILFYFLCWSPGIRASLFYVLLKRFGTRNTLVKIALAFVCLYWLVFSIYWYVDHIIVVQTGKRLVAIASTAALQIDPNDLENLHFARDMQRPEYQRVFKQINDVRRKNSEVKYVYILRPTETEGMWQFVADADSNYFLPFDGYFGGNRKVSESDESAPTGVYFDLKFSNPKIFKDGINMPVIDDSMVENQWGGGLTASAPILDEKGRTIAILMVDEWQDKHPWDAIALLGVDSR